MLIKKFSKYGYIELEGDENNIHFTSDLHLLHKNILVLCKRPFSDVEQMNQTLIDNWNSVVKENDIVFNLGDFCWSESADLWGEFINRLNGRQALIMGNHDSRKTLEKISKRYLLLDDEDYESGKPVESERLDKLFLIRERLELRHNGERYMLDHYPTQHYNGNYHSVRLLTGHTHEKDSCYSPSHYSVCVERNNYRPVSLHEINMLLTMQCRDNIWNLRLFDYLNCGKPVFVS
jgi:calcineurin-like phosphoesterase family protein